jgi:hypothetical protein
MKLKIGQSAKPGDFLALSRRGNIRKLKQGELPFGCALSRLRRGRIAEELVAADGTWRGWAEVGIVDLRLTATSIAYLLDPTVINEKLLNA